MDFGGWHGCGYCDYGGGCWPVPWWVCLVVVGFFSLVPQLDLPGAIVDLLGDCGSGF